MALIYEYTGGNQGTHSVTVSKPIGGGVNDIQHIPFDQFQIYSENGYFQLDTDGTFPHSGYCVNQPIDAEHPSGFDCWPASTTPVLFNAPRERPESTPEPHVAVPAHHDAPIMLPHVGAGSDVLLALLVAIVITAVMTRFKRA